MTDTVPLEPSLLHRDGIRLAYHRTLGRLPGITFLTGFQSDMTGTKAVALEHWARAQGSAFLRFDYSGHGASGGAFIDGTIGAWADDAVAALDALTEGPQVLVGSSMGGWLMLLVALRRPERVKGLVGISAAPDFTEDLIWQRLEAGARGQLMSSGEWHVPGGHSTITKALVEDGRKHLLLRAPVPITCPVRLLAGLNDNEVPWQTSLRLSEQLASLDVRLTLVKGADHRLSRPQDIALITQAVAELA